MNLERRINIIATLGNDFKNVLENHNDVNFPSYEKIKAHNPWFTEENVKFCLQNWATELTTSNLQNFCSAYNISNELCNKTVAIVMAGNIPLVGLHDLICAILCGWNIKAKLSSKDNILMKWLIDRLIQVEPVLGKRISICENMIGDFDAVIATGSNNSNRYFENYFAKYNKILRHNRNSVAILTGCETKEELELLADDVFCYFGLGCRNVSKLYLPVNYDFNLMGEAFQKYANIINNNKYNNNYSYQYAVLAMNKIEHVNFGNVLLTQKKDFASPIGVLNFEYYDNLATVIEEINVQKDNIQCVVAKNKITEQNINFGETQKPKICNFADNIDSIKFLTEIC